ncbi:MAG: FGGY family carbohydrate kinase [Anaerolineae bacterium]|nr:FGGY family carbohydrate kinase [Anaerolineae bacterium]
MSLLGIDIGTTGCKVACFTDEGQLVAAAYREYDIDHPQAGWAELDAAGVWSKTKSAIQQVAQRATVDPIRAVAVSSLGEAVVPLSRDRKILGPSILNFDVRGEPYLDTLAQVLPASDLYGINGNTLGNHYGLTKLLWIRDQRPQVYEQTDKFVPWSGFVAMMLGAEPAVDASLANRTLLFDLETVDWSPRLLALAGLDHEKLPEAVPSGRVIGTISPGIAAELGLPGGVVITAGAHDQCANAVGCGVIEPGRAVYGMGTFICITPVFKARPDAQAMILRGLNTEHHAVPDAYVSFIYNQGGSLVKWYRDTFAAEEHRQSQARGEDVYGALFSELPDGPSGLTVLPHFTTTGPPEFVPDSAGVIAGLRIETRRGAILKGIVEGATFYLRSCIDGLPGTGIAIDDFRAVGGGSKSDVWVQLTADLLGRPLTRPVVTEAGALGAAIIAGVGSGRFRSYAEAVEVMVRPERTFEPDMARHLSYAEWYGAYREMWPLMAGYLRAIVQRGR